MERIRVTLDADEYNGLVDLCERELRSVPDQVRHLVRDALHREGLLSVEEAENSPRRATVGAADAR
jgi:hypothetical protein